MILGAEIGLTVYGLLALIRGKASASKGAVLTGWRARVVGLICMSVLPLAIFIGLIAGVVAAMQGVDVANVSPFYFIWVDILAIVMVLVFASVLGKVFLKQQSAIPPVIPNSSHSGSMDPTNPYGRI